jgi:glc operon protein GlcG
MISIRRGVFKLFVFVTSFVLSHSAFAQSAPAPYGIPITIEQAKIVMVAAESEAQKNKWQVVISIVDSGGHLVSLQRLDAQSGSVDIATGKAVTAAAYRRTTKSIEDALTAGGAGLRLLGARNVTPLQGGIPILHNGKIIGAIGVSGVLGSQDEQVAIAGAAALNPK